LVSVIDVSYASICAMPGASRRLLLAGAAGFLVVGVWTMHFIGMLAAPLPADAVYLILPTIVSFLICTLVVSVSVFFVSIGDATWTAVVPEGLDDITLHGVDREVRAQLKARHDPQGTFSLAEAAT
jgi:hypothetical protein